MGLECMNSSQGLVNVVDIDCSKLVVDHTNAKFKQFLLLLGCPPTPVKVCCDLFRR